MRSTQEINIPKVEIILTDFKNLDNHKNDIEEMIAIFASGQLKKMHR